MSSGSSTAWPLCASFATTRRSLAIQFRQIDCHASHRVVQPIRQGVAPQARRPLRRTMTPSELSTRRKRAIAVFVGLAVVGVLLNTFAPERSSAKSLGQAFMIAWLPGVAWFVVWFAKKRAPVLTQPPGFSSETALSAHLTAIANLGADAETALRGAHPKALNVVLLLGTEGFTARIWPVDGDRATPNTVRVQILRPELVLSRLPPGASARVLLGSSVSGELRILALAEA